MEIKMKLPVITTIMRCLAIMVSICLVGLILFFTLNPHDAEAVASNVWEKYVDGISETIESTESTTIEDELDSENLEMMKNDDVLYITSESAYNYVNSYSTADLVLQGHKGVSFCLPDYDSDYDYHELVEVVIKVEGHVIYEEVMILSNIPESVFDLMLEDSKQSIELGIRFMNYGSDKDVFMTNRSVKVEIIDL